MPLAHRRLIAVLTAMLAAVAFPFAGNATAGEAVHYSLDPVHTRVMFAIEHAGFSKAIGTVSGSTGSLEFDPDDWRSAKLQARVPMARVDLGDAAWNKATLAGNLLDVEDHPSAEFVSTRVEPVGPGRASVHGTLTLRGVSRPIVLDVTLNAAKRHPLPPFRRTVGFSATAMLSRKDFGIDAWPTVIGDAVELRIEAEATRSRGGDGETEDAINAPDTPGDASPSPEAASDGTPSPLPAERTP